MKRRVKDERRIIYFCNHCGDMYRSGDHVEHFVLNNERRAKKHGKK